MIVTDCGTAPDGSALRRITLRDGDFSADVLTYGATLQRLLVPGRGGVDDVILGFDDASGYLAEHPYFGVTVGRVAGRIGGASFPLDGRTYTLDKNEPDDPHDAPPRHTLHGGSDGWSRRHWTLENADARSVRLSLVSPDGDSGFPGRVDIAVTYALEADTLAIYYEATTDAPTPLAPTNHAYFNLAGTGDILGQTLEVSSTRFARTHHDLSFTGETPGVAGTPCDLRVARRVGEAVAGMHRRHGPMYLLDNATGTPRPAAVLRDEVSGRRMVVSTTEPCVQFYSGVMLKGEVGKSGRRYEPFAGLCLECQRFPDALNHPDADAGPLVSRPGETYRQETRHAFDVT